MSRTVEFFYDFTSPTAYLAWARLPAIVERTGAKIVYRPMFLGGVMQTTGNRPPGTVEAKGRWMQADLFATAGHNQPLRVIMLGTPITPTSLIARAMRRL